MGGVAARWAPSDAPSLKRALPDQRRNGCCAAHHSQDIRAMHQSRAGGRSKKVGRWTGPTASWSTSPWKTRALHVVRVPFLLLRGKGGSSDGVEMSGYLARNEHGVERWASHIPMRDGAGRDAVADGPGTRELGPMCSMFMLRLVCPVQGARASGSCPHGA